MAIIPAYSPPAKGRVERKNGVPQDRLVKEWPRRPIAAAEAANADRVDEYLQHQKGRLAGVPRRVVDYHRPRPRGLDLRTVGGGEAESQAPNDWTVRDHPRYFQMEKAHRERPRPGQRLGVGEWRDGSIHRRDKDRERLSKELPERPPPRRPLPQPRQRPWIPGPDHPWRRWACGPAAGSATAGARNQKTEAGRSAGDGG